MISPLIDRCESVVARVVESAVIAVVGAALGRLVGGLINPTVGWIVAVISGVNGLLSGWRQIYSWRNRDGWLAFVLDSTWGVVMVAGSLFAHGWAALTRAAHNEASLSTRQNRHVYRRGAQSWGIGGSLAGVVAWLRGGRSKPMGAVIQSLAYYSNPFEWWAYSRDDYWPPSGAVGDGWKKPIVRPLADVRAERCRH